MLHQQAQAKDCASSITEVVVTIRIKTSVREGFICAGNKDAMESVPTPSANSEMVARGVSWTQSIGQCRKIMTCCMNSL